MPQGKDNVDEDLRSDCLRLFEACVVQIRSGEPGPSLLTSREFEATLVHLCERLRATPGNRAAVSDGERPWMELIVRGNPTDASDGMNQLRSWLKGAEKVMVCDPYLLQFKATEMYPSVESYARAFVGLFPPSAKRIDLYTNSYNSRVRPAVLRPLKEGRNVRHFSSDSLHDRFIIKNRLEGKILGTSFGGFGCKFFAMLDLPADDVSAVRSELRALCPSPVGSRPRK